MCLDIPITQAAQNSSAELLGQRTPGGGRGHLTCRLVCPSLSRWNVRYTLKQQIIKYNDIPFRIGETDS